MKLLPLLSTLTKNATLSAQAASGCVRSYVKQLIPKQLGGAKISLLVDVNYPDRSATTILACGSGEFSLAINQMPKT